MSPRIHPSVPPPQCLHYRDVQPCQNIFCGCWDSEPGPDACMQCFTDWTISLLSRFLHVHSTLILALLVDNDWWVLVLYFPLFPEHLEIPPFFFSPLQHLQATHPHLASFSLDTASFWDSHVDKLFCVLPLSQHSNPVHTVPNADHVTVGFLFLAVDFSPLPPSLATGCSSTSVAS